MRARTQPGAGDALLVVDVQNDFLPGGSLAVPRGDEVIPPLERALREFVARGLPVFASRDWHPPRHCSFRERGGPWPPHCLRGSHGGRFALALPPSTEVVSKGTLTDADAYSAFDGTDLAARLRARRVRRLFVGGLATDYCVRRTVEEALARGFAVELLVDAIRAVEIAPGDGRRAVDEMLRRGARAASLVEVSAPAGAGREEPVTP